MSDVTGQRTTLNVNQTSRRIDMVAKIKLLEPDKQPFSILSSEINSAPAHNPKFQWQEDELAPRYDAINNGGGYNTTATSLVVDNGAYFAEHDLVKNTRTGEVFRVTGVSSNTLTVTRGVGNSGTGVAMNDNDELLIIGSVFAEGSLSPDARSDNQSDVYNYTEITRTTFEETETQSHTDSINTPNDWEHQAHKAGLEHAKTLEFKKWFGKPSENTVGGKPLRTTGGALHYITTNITDAGGTMSETDFFAALRPIFRYGKKIKWGIPAPLVVDVLNTYPRSKLQVIQSQVTEKYGLKVMEYISPHGTLRCTTNWHFEGAEYAGYLPILDLSNVRKRYLANSKGSRDTHINKDIQAPDLDGHKSEYLTEDGLEFGLEKTHGLITGITG